MIVFGSQLWQRPDDWTPPATTHPDPLVMAIAKVIMDHNTDVTGGWDYQIRGASQMDGTQRGDYYGEPYAREIEAHIQIAEAVRAILP